MQLLTRQIGRLSLISRPSQLQQTPSIITSSIKTRHLHTSSVMASPLKRKAEKPAASSAAKKQKVIVPEYHTATQRRDSAGEVVWPARSEQIERARNIIKEWYTAYIESLFFGTNT
jgi:hypothetical protein